MATHRVRLSIDVDAELRRRLKAAAAARDLSVRDYVEHALRAALDTDAAGDRAGERVSAPDRARIDRPLSRKEQERGMRAADELKRLARELLERRGGNQFPPSSELLHEMREERTRDLGDDR